MVQLTIGLAELWPAIVIWHKTSVICRFVTCSPAAPETVDTDEASCREQRQDAARDGDPETPAEIRVLLTHRYRGTVRIARETAERRHRSHLKDNCNNRYADGHAKRRFLIVFNRCKVTEFLWRPPSDFCTSKISVPKDNVY